jgi:hypothetical protein
VLDQVRCLSFVVSFDVWRRCCPNLVFGGNLKYGGEKITNKEESETAKLLSTDAG